MMRDDALQASPPETPIHATVLVKPVGGSVAIRQIPASSSRRSSKAICIAGIFSRKRNVNVRIFPEESPHNRAHPSPHCRSHYAEFNPPCFSPTYLFNPSQYIISIHQQSTHSSIKILPACVSTTLREWRIKSCVPS